MNALLFRSLYLRIAVLIACAALPAVGVVVYLTSLIYGHVAEEAESRLAGWTRLAASHEEQAVLGASLAVRGVAAFAGHAPLDAPSCAVAAQAVVRESGTLRDLMVVDREERVLCAAHGDVLDPSAVVSGMRDHAGVRVGGYVRGVSGDPVRPVIFPVQGDGEDRAARVVAVIGLDWFDAFLEDAAVHPDMVFEILDGQDRTPSGAAVERGAGPDGRDYLFSHTRLYADGPGTAAVLRAGVPLDAVRAEITATMLWPSLFVLAGIVLALVLGFAAARIGIVAPIRALAVTARRIEAGDRTARVGRQVQAQDEIGELARHFDVMAETLENHARSLEHRVRERTLQLESSNRELAAFSYSVSHDLRAPLRAIDGFSRALLDYHSASLDDEAQSFLNRIIGASRRMAGLIDDMLALSRISRAELKKQPVDVSALCAEVVEELRAQDPSRLCEVIIKPGITAYADPALLRVVLANVIGNAWKFTRHTEHPRIEIESECKDIHYTDIVVRDNGAGFDMKYSEKLFGAFQRLHSEREFEGTGIGLATVQRVIARHDGQVSAWGAVGKGAVFTLRLPVQEPGDVQT